MASDSGSTYSCSHEDSIHFSAAVYSAQVGSSHSAHVTSASPNQLPRSDLGCEATMRHGGARRTVGREKESRAFPSNFSGNRFHRLILSQKFFASKFCLGSFALLGDAENAVQEHFVACCFRGSMADDIRPPAPAPYLVLPPFLLYLRFIDPGSASSHHLTHHPGTSQPSVPICGNRKKERIERKGPRIRRLKSGNIFPLPPLPSPLLYPPFDIPCPTATGAAKQPGRGALPSSLPYASSAQSITNAPLFSSPLRSSLFSSVSPFLPPSSFFSPSRR